VQTYEIQMYYQGVITFREAMTLIRMRSLRLYLAGLSSYTRLVATYYETY